MKKYDYFPAWLLDSIYDDFRFSLHDFDFTDPSSVKDIRRFIVRSSFLVANYVSSLNNPNSNGNDR